VRRFVILGRTATAGADFLLDDLPGTSGRLDVPLRCIRAALLTSHGVRHDTVIDLVLLGGPSAPRVVRIAGATVKFLRPDERPLATLVKKSLEAHDATTEPGFTEVRPGISIARGGLELVLSADTKTYVLDESGVDVRTLDLDPNPTFIIGDHLGFDDPRLDAFQKISLGPVSVHSDDAVAILSNELDRGHH
jgi:tRNA (pseudouridine54-N1)-methyltransferase